MTDRIRTPFAMVPCWVIDRVTDAVALRVYTHLAWKYANAARHAFPAEVTLATELGYGERTIRRSIKALRDADALVVTRSRKSDGHYGRNAYRLPLDDPRDTLAAGSSEPQETDDHTYGAEQGEQTVPAGRNQRPPVAGDGRPPQAYREPDLQKQPEQEEQNVAAATSVEDQNMSACAPPPRQRGAWRAPEADHTHEDPPTADVWDMPPTKPPATFTGEALAQYGQSEKVFRHFMFLNTCLPGGLEDNECNALEGMLQRPGYHWKRALRRLCKQRGYAGDYTEALVARIVGKVAA